LVTDFFHFKNTIMNRNLYYTVIFFLGISMVAVIFQTILQLQIGSRINTLQSALPWFITMSVINLAAVFILLKYFHYKKYWYTFSVGIINFTATLAFYIVVYFLLAYSELQSYYLISYQIVLITNILLALSLIFTKAGKRIWLRIAGIAGVLVFSILLATFVRTMNSQDMAFRAAMEKVLIWTLFSGILVSFFLIMNFLKELNLLKDEQADKIQLKGLNVSMLISGVLALSLMMYFGGRLASESQNIVNYFNNRADRAAILARPFEARIYVSTQGDTMRYRFLKPREYDPQISYPLVVCLHGGGGWGTDNVMQIEGSWSAQNLSLDANRERYPAFLFVPQCPPGKCWGGIPNLPFIDSLVFETINALENEFAIDKKKRYVIGESLGGYGTWYFICRRPDMFAAAVPVCGSGNSELASKIVGVPVWAFHGRKDRSVPVKGSRDMIESIRKAGGDPRYTEFPDAGHIINSQVYGTPDLLDWLFAQEQE